MIGYIRLTNSNTLTHLNRTIQKQAKLSSIIYEERERNFMACKKTWTKTIIKTKQSSVDDAGKPQ